VSEAAPAVSETLLAKIWHELQQCKTLLLLVLLTAFVIPALTAKTQKPGEFYPFSNYPMYASFDDETYYVYITDSQANPLPAGRLFGSSVSQMKKMYDGELKKIKNDTQFKLPRTQLPAQYKQQAAQTVLKHLVQHVPVLQQAVLAKLSGLQMYQVDIQLVQGSIRKESQLVGELTLATAAQP
jgi:hypothetical protein